MVDQLSLRNKMATMFFSFRLSPGAKTRLHCVHTTTAYSDVTIGSVTQCYWYILIILYLQTHTTHVACTRLTLSADTHIQSERVILCVPAGWCYVCGVIADTCREALLSRCSGNDRTHNVHYKEKKNDFICACASAVRAGSLTMACHSQSTSHGVP